MVTDQLAGKSLNTHTTFSKMCSLEPKSFCRSFSNDTQQFYKMLRQITVGFTSSTKCSLIRYTELALLLVHSVYKTLCRTKLTNSMKHSPSWEANRSSASQEILRRRSLRWTYKPTVYLYQHKKLSKKSYSKWDSNTRTGRYLSLIINVANTCVKLSVDSTNSQTSGEKDHFNNHIRLR
jgi:hypothetical protein